MGHGKCLAVDLRLDDDEVNGEGGSLRGSAGCGAGALTRAPYVAAEGVYGKKNGGTVDTAHFQLRCRQAVHSRVDKFRIAAWETI